MYNNFGATMANYRDRILKPRERWVSIRTNDEEIELLESALEPHENRSEFIMNAAKSLAYKRLKNKSKNSQS